jgi:hypothetical protein
MSGRWVAFPQLPHSMAIGPFLSVQMTCRSRDFVADLAMIQIASSVEMEFIAGRYAVAERADHDLTSHLLRAGHSGELLAFLHHFIEYEEYICFATWNVSLNRESRHSCRCSKLYTERVSA